MLTSLVGPGLHVPAGGSRDPRGHEGQRQDGLREHPADLRLAPRVRYHQHTSCFLAVQLPASHFPLNSNHVCLCCPPPSSFFLVELERCVQNHDLLADLFIRHVSRFPFLFVRVTGSQLVTRKTTVFCVFLLTK